MDISNYSDDGADIDMDSMDMDNMDDMPCSESWEFSLGRSVTDIPCQRLFFRTLFVSDQYFATLHVTRSFFCKPCCFACLLSWFLNSVCLLGFSILSLPTTACLFLYPPLTLISARQFDTSLCLPASINTKPQMLCVRVHSLNLTGLIEFSFSFWGTLKGSRYP